MPLSYSISLYRGDTFRQAFVLWADPAKTQPFDLTGVQIAAEIRGGQVVVPFVCTPDGNIIHLELPAASSRLVVPGSAWDLQLTDSGGDVRTIVRGSVLTRLDVTQSV